MIYKKIKEYVPEKYYYTYAAIFMAFVAAVLLIGSYYYMYEFLKSIIIDENVEGAIPIAVRILTFLICNTLVYFFSVWVTHAIAFRLETNLKKKGLEHLMRASFSFFDKHESGKVRKIIDDNTVLTHMSVAHLIPDLSTAAFAPVLGMGLAFYIDYKLGIIFTTTFLLGFLFLVKMMGNQGFMEKYMEALDNMNAGAVEYVRGIQVMKIFKTDAKNLKEFYRSVVDYSIMALKYSMSCRRWYVLFQVIFNSTFLIVLFMYYMGNPEPRVFLTKFMFYVLFNGILMVSFMKIMYVGMYVMQASTAIEKIEQKFAEMDERKLESGSLTGFNGNTIEFKNVSFGYENDMVIEDLSFTLEEGKTYALVGASGSGKSTLAKLISGFYSLDKGEIHIGGNDVTKYSEKVLSRNIANVFQNAKLFKRSIYENVRLGKPDATREEVMEALHMAQCDEILNKFEARENTIIGSKGVHLSGGEVQRIAIARSILKDAGIVILDEASAAADPENEYELQKALSNLMKNRTVIMIAHRLSSIKNVDEILVIEKGKITERGSHAELMGRDSHYKVLQNQFMTANEWRVSNE